MRKVPFEKLSSANLNIDAIYEGDKTTSSYAGEPLHHLIPGLGTQGGFRKRKGLKNELVGLVLTTSGAEVDWPDFLDPYTGTFTYYGDNRTPGKGILDTKAGGNKTLEMIFELAHSGSAKLRATCPLILIFASTGIGRDFVFRGLAVPGSPHHSAGEDLVAAWRTSGGERFQNYRAIFTVLDCDDISGDWVREVFETRTLDVGDDRIPVALSKWIKSGRITPLISETRKIRTIEEQTPAPGLDTDLIKTILARCGGDPYSFEPVAAEIWRMTSREPVNYEMTRPTRDGGRDAIGELLLGPPLDTIPVKFALEAKLYSKSRVGVRDVSRLISRLKHREFGVLVTTSVLDKQAYTEIRTDQHPIVVISGRDIAEVLVRSGYNSVSKLNDWLDTFGI